MKLSYLYFTEKICHVKKKSFTSLIQLSAELTLISIQNLAKSIHYEKESWPA